jgi:hypothetical protein
VDVENFEEHNSLDLSLTVASGQTNVDWDCLQANHMLSSFETDSLVRLS